MKPGFRVPAQASKKEELRQIKTELANLQMAGRISQMMTQQLMQSLKNMSDDLGAALNQLYELQYKYNAVTQNLNLDPEVLNKLANEQRLKDFNEAAAKQDVKDNLLESDTVGAESTVTITSTAKDEQGNDRGIFRSRLKLSESGVPDLIKGLDGKKVGDKVIVKLNGIDHEVELLSVRNPAPQPEVAAPAAETTH
jgi:hypothetical protein